MEGCAQLPYCHHHKHYFSGIENIIERSDLSRIQTAGQSSAQQGHYYVCWDYYLEVIAAYPKATDLSNLLVSDFCP